MEFDVKVLKLVDMLREKGFRVTPQRLSIARIIFEQIKSHPSFTEILSKARKEIPGVSTSTVYNTLKLLEELKLVQNFCVAGETLYDSPYPHVNIVEPSGRVVDAPDEVSRQVVALLEKSLGKRVKNVIVYVED